MKQYTIFVPEKLHPLGLEMLSGETNVVVERGLTPEQLIARLNEVSADGLIVRSGTKVTRELIKAVPSLKVVGRAGTGVDNIDLKAATELGLVVVNAPTGNSVAAAEHAVALMMALARNIPQADAAMRRGEWNRHAYIGTALVGKTLGLVALGRVGGEVAKRATALGMSVVAFDPYCPPERAKGVKLVDLNEVWAKSDFISLHAPLLDSTHHMINHGSLAKMKRGVYLINDARGGLIDEEALIEALDSGQVAGAALDVFQQEPPRADNRLIGRPDVIVTPHLGASTTEAQMDVAREVVEAVIGTLKGETVSSVVNAPMIAPELLADMMPYMELAEKLARLAVQVAPSGLDNVRIIYEGKPALPDTRPLKAAVIKGLLESISTSRINRINAEVVAKQRGLRITEVKREEPQGPVRDTISIELGNWQLKRVQGAILRGSPHVIRIQNFWIDLELNGCILLCHNKDQPGTIGQVGTLLGQKEVNISFMQVGRIHARGDAVMAIGLDEVPDKELVDEIATIPNITSSKLIIMT